MSIPQPQKVRAVTFGDYVRVSWTGSVEAPVEGYKIYVGDTPIPNWATAIDNGFNDGDDGISVKNFQVLIHVPTKTICRWETFETYPTGEVEAMNDGGKIWDGAWSNVKSDIGYKGYGDDFESYPVGMQTQPMNKGDGWDGAWEG